MQHDSQTLIQARRVLVIEDDPTVRSLVVDTLSDAGFDAREAVEGRAALDVLREWRPDLIVLDLHMAGMDGWQFRAEQRRRGLCVDVPLIIQSADPKVRSHAESLGAAAVFPNPFDLKALQVAAERLAARRSSAAGAS